MRGLKFVKVVLLVSLLALLVAGSAQSFAQSPVSETYVIQAGSGQGNYRAFAPAMVQVHPGDTVRWITRGCNVHFADGKAVWAPSIAPINRCWHVMSRSKSSRRTSPAKSTRVDPVDEGSAARAGICN